MLGLNQILIPFLILPAYSGDPAEGVKAYDVYYRWKALDFNYDCAPMSREEMITEHTYIPQNIIMSSLKISGDRMFVYTPRFLPGVPSTVNWVPYSKKLPNDPSPPLNPYPSWEMQEIGNCKALQSVVATEIDQWNRMWVLDNGRLNVLGPTPNNKCPPKIVLIDLNTDKVLDTYIFPADVISRNMSLPKDLSISCTCPEDCVLYICDITDPRIIIYDHYRRRSWYVTHPSMNANPSDANITIAGVQIYVPIFGISGTGLAPRSQNYDTFYYGPLAGFNIYNVSTQVLLSASCGSTLKDKDVFKFFTKSSQSDGMTMDARGRLFYGSLEDNALETLNTNRRLKERRVAQSDVNFQFLDTFGFDNVNRYLFAVSHKFQDFGAYNLSDYNIRVLRFNTHSRSYIY